ncbi:Domain of unknown function (DUF1707) [Seminavis robusta]|uniref:Cell wall-active antibiotics response LiaF-like C-terminal domain-containing protein n=1 Tax=Seminavis robusta TaxID=568900 RepID=A0A9N8HVB3_9STRA|nr:Domain of unknown function (DUF1707) [Seminavis robusta]|eukprot:Sro1485_g276570.1 Domain of unknown function (DUF1707) (243) ;mRNA; f:19201-19929
MQKFAACPKCASTASLAGSNFCSTCGARLTEEPEVEVPMAPAVPVDTVAAPSIQAVSAEAVAEAPMTSVRVPNTSEPVRPGLDPFVQSTVTMRTLEMESAVFYKKPTAAMLDGFAKSKAMGGILVIETSDLKGKFTVPKTIQVGQILNGAKIDMSIADFVHPVTTIVAGSVLGSLSITVPRGVRVESHGIALLGAFGGLKEGQTVHAGQIENSPLVVIKGVTILGGVTVKVNNEVMSIRVVE